MTITQKKALAKILITSWNRIFPIEMATKPSNNKFIWKYLLNKITYADTISFYIIMDRIYEFIKNQEYICDSRARDLFIETTIIPLLNQPIVRILLTLLFLLETIITPEKKKEIFDKQCVYLNNRVDWRELVDKKQYNAIIKHINSIMGDMHHGRQLIEENGKFYLYRRNVDIGRNFSIISQHGFFVDIPNFFCVKYAFDSKLEYPFVFTNDYNTHLVYIDNNLRILLERFIKSSGNFIQNLAMTSHVNNMNPTSYYNLEHLTHTLSIPGSANNFAIANTVQKEYNESPLMVKLNRNFYGQKIGAHV